MPVGRAAARLCRVVLAAAVVTPLTIGRASADVAVLVIDGRGWGHGVGMAQDGALEMGRKGYGLAQILGQFYPGAAFGHASGDVRVPLLDVGGAPATETVTFPDGGQVVDTLSGAQSPGFPRPVPAGGTAVFTWDGTRYRASTTPEQGAGGGAAVGRAGAGAAGVGGQEGAEGAPAVGGQGGAGGAPAGAVGEQGAEAGGGPAVGTTSTTRPLLSVPTPPSPPPPPRPPGTTTTTRATVRSTTTSTTAATPTTSAARPAPGDAPVSSTRPLWALPSSGGALGVPARGRTYRGDMEIEASAGHLRLVNQLDVETYLTGMGEVLNPGWPAASLETQEVAARTYALRAMALGGELCDDPRCQVYLGTAGEYPAASQAVAATAGVVLVAGGGLVDAVYSANAGGFSASQQEGFGSADDVPYLRAAPYPTGDPMHWTVTVSAADAGRLLGLPGPLTAAAVTQRGPSGRALAVTVASGSSSTTVSGLAFAAVLDLRSTLIGARLGEAASAPPPPSGGPQLQVPPGEAGAVAAGGVLMHPGGGSTRASPAALPPARPGGDGGVPWPLALVAGVLVALTGAGAARRVRGT